MTITQQVLVEPSAMVVALPEEQLVLCIEVFGRAGLTVHRTERDASCERLTRLMPQIVVVATELDFSLREMIDDRAVAVGAIVVALPASADFATVEQQLDEAVDRARALRGKAPRSP